MQEVFEKIIAQLEELTQEECTLHECGIRSERCKPCIAKLAIEIVNQVAAEYNNGWIPVSKDNLPKDREDVLILWGGGNRSTAYHVSGGAGGWFFNYGFDHKGNTAVPYKPYAWQPLPKLYQPKGE